MVLVIIIWNVIETVFLILPVSDQVGYSKQWTSSVDVNGYSLGNMAGLGCDGDDGPTPWQHQHIKQEVSIHVHHTLIVPGRALGENG